jgi:hypothetical protein
MIGAMSLLAALAADDRAFVIAIVLARLLVPLLIPRYPLAIVAALLLDAVDNSLLAEFTSVDLGPDGPYQSYDKALDIYYLSIAQLSMLRNWTSQGAVRVGQFLFYYRLVGVLLFELFESRTLLLVFPNTFEYFFIAYEVVRTRFDPARISARSWLLTAAAIWVFVKLPQEYWIHIAQRDFTDTVADYPWFGILCALGILAILAVLWFVVRPRLPEPDWGWRLAADPLPGSPPEHHDSWRELAEKVFLLSLLSVIFAEILPTVTMSALEVALGAGLVVGVSTLFTTDPIRDRVSSPIARGAALLATNLALVYLASRLLSDAEDFPLDVGLFFAFLITLLVSLYDRYKPVHDARFAGAAP